MLKSENLSEIPNMPQLDLNTLTGVRMAFLHGVISWEEYQSYEKSMTVSFAEDTLGKVSLEQVSVQTDID